MPVIELSYGALAVANIAVWGAAQGGSGYIAHRLPSQRLDHDGPLLRLRSWESGGRFYERRLSIQSWKDRLPEAGALFAGGMSKRKLPGRGRDDLERFAAETRRAERGHWLSLIAIPVSALWNPPLGIALMSTYGLAINAPFIAIQRYNRARIGRMLSRRH